jgi:hypothetical protein
MEGLRRPWKMWISKLWSKSACHCTTTGTPRVAGCADAPLNASGLISSPGCGAGACRLCVKAVPTGSIKIAEMWSLFYFEVKGFRARHCCVMRCSKDNAVYVTYVLLCEHWNRRSYRVRAFNSNMGNILAEFGGEISQWNVHREGNWRLILRTVRKSIIRMETGLKFRVLCNDEVLFWTADLCYYLCNLSVSCVISCVINS